MKTFLLLLIAIFIEQTTSAQEAERVPLDTPTTVTLSGVFEGKNFYVVTPLDGYLICEVSQTNPNGTFAAAFFLEWEGGCCGKLIGSNIFGTGINEFIGNSAGAGRYNITLENGSAGENKITFKIILDSNKRKNDTEPNDFFDLDNANLFKLNTSTEGHIGFVNPSNRNTDVLDTYKLTTTKVGNLKINFDIDYGTYQLKDNGAVLTLLDSVGLRFIAENKDANAASLYYENLNPGIYYIRASVSTPGYIWGDGYKLSNSFNPSKLIVQSVIPNNSAFPEPKILYNGFTDDIKNLKICADGSSATQLKYIQDSGFGNQKIQFKINSDITGSDIDQYGSFSSATSSLNNDTVYVSFNHPTYVDSLERKQFRTDTILIVDAKSNVILNKIPINIYRAPVIMIHGLWSDQSSFEPLSNFLNKSGYYNPTLIKRVDYSHTNSLSFAANQKVVPDNITSIFERARENNFSTGKVDIICHSMAGNLSRQYIQSQTFQLKKDINKLITLNTPHSGSQAANLLLNSTTCEGIAANAAVSFWLFYQSITKWHNSATVYDGAVGDLEVNSKAISDLNTTYLNLNVVPSHCITTEDDPSLLSNLATFFITAYISASLPCSAITASEFLDYLFYNEPNDYVVSLPSQQGGLTFLNTSHFYNQSHTGVQSNDSVQLQVIKLLNIASTNSTNFSQKGFVPIDLKTNTHYFSKTNNTNKENLLDSINITYPTSLQSFNPKDTIHIMFNSSTKINKTVFQAFSGSNVLSKDIVLSTGLINYIVPDDAFGKVGIIILGYDTTTGFVDYDTVTVNINLTASLDSMTLYPDTIYTQVAQNSPIIVTGYFNNGYSYDISNIDGIEYKVSDTNISVNLTSNLIQGKMIGTTNVLVSFLGQNKNVTVIVIPKDSTTDVILPINLISFTGQSQLTYNELTWRFEQDDYFSHFILQRSNDNFHWLQVDKINSYGNSMIHNYQYKDSSLLNKIVYYRLLIVNKDGSYITSNIVIVRRNNFSSNIKVFPNPTFTNEVYLNLDNTYLSKVSIYLIDISGRILKTFTADNSNEKGLVKLNLSGIKPSVYFLKIQDEKKSETVKLIVMGF